MQITAHPFHSIARIVSRLAAAALLMGATSSVRLAAQPITFTFSGVASGIYDGNPFTDAALDVVIHANVANLAPFNANSVAYTGLTGTVNVTGFVLANFIQPLYVFRNVLGPTVGFGTTTNSDLMDVKNDAFAGYELTTSIGPVQGNVPYTNAQFSNVETTQGALTVRSFSQFQVQAVTSVVPEPASVAFVAFGMAGIGIAYRRRRV